MTNAYAVTGVLDRRRQGEALPLFSRFLGLAAAIHLVAALAGWIVPRWTRTAPTPLEYVAVQVVPAARLGVERPVPPKPAPEPVRESPPPAKPVPEIAKPKVEAPPSPSPTAPPKPTPATTRPPSPTRTAAEKVEPPPEVQGSARGTVSGLALGASVAGLDNPDFTYGYYVDQMLSMIQSNWVRPIVGSGVEATISYRISRDGRVTDVSISQSSGMNSFDLAALRAVQASSPLPPLPRAFRDGWLGVHLIFR